jgi:parallel beta-helix repeat protein
MSTPKQLLVSKRKLFLALISIALICSLASGSIMYVVAQGGSTPITISSGPYPGAPTYTIYTDGTTYYSKSASGAVTSSTVTSTLINSVAASNTHILVKAGTYSLTATITFNSLSNFVFEGEGNNTIFQVTASTNINAFTITSCQSSIFSSFQIDGNRANNVYAGNWQNGGIFAGDSVGTTSNTNCLFEKLFIHDTPGDATSFRNVADTTIQNCWVSNTLREGIFVSISTNTIVTENHVTSCGSTNDISYKWHSIYCYGGNIAITNNIVTYAGSDGIEVYGLQKGIIANNIVTYSNRNGVYVAYGAPLTGETQVTVSNNIIAYSGQNASETWRYGIFVNGAPGTMVLGNQVSYSGSIGIYASDSNNIVINNNKVSNNTQNGISIYQSNGVSAIGNNVEMNTDVNALSLDTVANSVINSNSVQAFSNTGVGYTISGVTNSLFSGNLVYTAYYSFLISASSNNRYSINFGYDCTLGPHLFENNGIANVTSSGYIAHGLGVTPTSVQVQIIGSNPGNIVAKPYFIDSTDIVVQITNVTSLSEPATYFNVTWVALYNP